MISLSFLLLKEKDKLKRPKIKHSNIFRRVVFQMNLDFCFSLFLLSKTLKSYLKKNQCIELIFSKNKALESISEWNLMTIGFVVVFFQKKK